MTNRIFIYMASNWNSVRLLRSSANIYWVTGRIKPNTSSVPCENDANIWLIIKPKLQATIIEE